MTYDLLKIFGKYFQDEKVVLDSYSLSDGYYYVIDEENNFEKLQVLNNESDNYELEKYIKTIDYYSKYINSNKALDTSYKEKINGKEYSMLKKICSNNIYTLFFKNRYVEGLLNKEDNKDAIPIEIFKKGIDKYFKVAILADDTTKHKPDPEPIYKCLDKISIKPEEAIFIGDSINDYLAAKNAGVDFGYATWGSVSNDGIDDPTYVFNRPLDLLKLL